MYKVYFNIYTRNFYGMIFANIYNDFNAIFSHFLKIISGYVPSIKGLRHRPPNISGPKSFYLYLKSRGIRQWTINWCTSLIMINKITHFKALIKVPKVLSQRIRESDYKTSGIIQCFLLPWLKNPNLYLSKSNYLFIYLSIFIN